VPHPCLVACVDALDLRRYAFEFGRLGHSNLVFFIYTQPPSLLHCEATCSQCGRPQSRRGSTPEATMGKAGKGTGSFGAHGLVPETCAAA